jgi:hypothetical protein
MNYMSADPLGAMWDVGSAVVTGKSVLDDLAGGVAVHDAYNRLMERQYKRWREAAWRFFVG